MFCFNYTFESQNHKNRKANVHFSFFQTVRSHERWSRSAHLRADLAIRLRGVELVAGRGRQLRDAVGVLQPNTGMPVGTAPEPLMVGLT